MDLSTGEAIRVMGSDDLNVPISSKVDTTHSVVKGAISGVPVLGGVVAEFFGQVIVPPLQKRSIEWMESVSIAIKDLQARTDSTNGELEKNEAFLSTVLSAYNIAIRNHDEAKLSALQNAVLNSAVLQAPDEVSRQLFLNFIESFTEWHIQLLVLFRQPTQIAKEKGIKTDPYFGGSLVQVIEKIYPEIGSRKNLYEIVWSDLFRAKLVDTENLYVVMTGTGMLVKRTTVLGDQFVDFISEPKIVD